MNSLSKTVSWIMIAGFSLFVVDSSAQTEIYSLIELHQVRNDLAGDYVLMNDIDASPTSEWNELVDAGTWNDATDYAIAPVDTGEYGQIPLVDHEGKAYYALENSGPGHGGAVEPGTDGDVWWETDLPAGHQFGWEPINGFTGIFDGQGHAITELYINRPEAANANGRGGYRVGFWGSIGACTIQDLQILDADVTAYDRSGVFYASASNAHIKRCVASGVIRGWSATGGFTSGQWAGTIVEDCAAHVTVIRREGSSSFGFAGFAGNARATSFLRSYSTGEVKREGTSDFSSRGFVNRWWLGDHEVRNCFWDVESSGQTSSPEGTGKTTAELQLRSTFTDLRTLGLGQQKNGTASATQGSTSVTGGGTSFTNDFVVGQMIRLDHGIRDAEYREIASIADDTNLTVTEPWGKMHQDVNVYEVAESDRWDMGRIPSNVKDYPLLSGKPSPAWRIKEPPIGTIIIMK